MDWPMLDMLDPEERRQLLSVSRRRRFGRNEVVFHEGDPANSLHLVASGHVSVRVSLPDGNSVTLAIVGAGQTFGELALLGKQARRAATVTALEGCETLSVQKESFDELRLGHPKLDRLLAEILADEVRRLDSRLLECLYLPADKRVLRRLATLARMYGDGRVAPVTVPLTQDVIASMAGTSRPTTNQALRVIEEAGVIVIGRAKIQVLDVAALVRRAR